VPSLDIYLDGTAEYTGSVELPAMDRGALALVVEESGKGKLVHLPNLDASATRRARRIEAWLHPEGSANLDVRVETKGALASEQRQRYHAMGTQRERLQGDLAAEFGGFELTPGGAAIETSDLEDIEQPVKVRVRGKALGLGRRDGSDVSIPLAPTGRLVSSFTSLSTRRQDVRLHVRSTLEDELVIHLPAGFKTKALPDTLRQDSPFGSFAIAAESSPGKVIVKTKIAFDKPRVTPAEYAAFRKFCEAADSAFAQHLLVGPSR
jgi:hypothetical protein